MEGRSEYKKGLWTVEEDKILTDYIRVHGKGKWNRVAKVTGLKRCGKSCRLRWINYLSPNVKRGNFSKEEDDLIIRLHNLLGNRWSLIAGRVPGRTDNQVKNHWNTHLSKKIGARRIKGKGRLVSNSSQVLSKSLQEDLSTTLQEESDFKPRPADCDDDHNEGQTQERLQEVHENENGLEQYQSCAVGSSTRVSQDDDLQLMMRSDDYDTNCFWFSNDELDLQPPCLMELLDKSLDHFVWHGL